ncbi:Coenzyme F420 hydrogenase/dehydrogenase, beta subunit C-terminal domain [Rhodococcus sp. BL-253-APC-6A1W]|uniref:Coenzyme F420 hydrogenase/dehydrogenase, beta subunit C-terminal domain n=1 Tax=Rhodococcus sp. BL-253-APC-6A1W TaxID=2725307 RepID=UPI001F109CD0|nr:Coenzyme F420 hydrogenase/dehydrogenase, beta subunit C-terminal domain [Rhodococcus sp. BL-253-APC-6A1W]
MHAWEAWASDEQFRFRGSSGGALSALTGWLLETGQIYSVTGASGKTENPRRTVAVDLTTRDEVLRAAGSRYAPVANVAQYRPVDQPVGFIGKPCEAAALRALSRIRNEENPPLIISFFCAGVPSQTATDRLVDRMGVGKSSPLVDLRYRGFGWPGDFYVADEDGNEGRMSYDESWGRVLGPTTQWRCKICPDGIGESADVVAGDYWSADAAGYPIFEDRKGTSVLIARTTRGQEVVEAAVSAGILCVREIDLDDVATVQPLQVERRMTISGRLLGRLLSGRRVPLYRGFGTGRFALSSPYRNLRAAAGTYLRSVKGLKQSESSLGETDG